MGADSTNSGNGRRHGEAVACFSHCETEGVRCAGHRLYGAAIRANAEVGAGQLNRFMEMRAGDFFPPQPRPK